METKVLTARIPLRLAREVDETATRLRRSRGWIVRRALSAWIDREDGRRVLTLEALDDVNRGHVLDHEAIQAWVDNLGTGKRQRLHAEGPE